MVTKFKLLLIALIPFFALAQTDSLKESMDLERGKKKALVFIAKKKRVGTLSFHMVRKDNKNRLEMTFEPIGGGKISTLTSIPTTLKFEDGAELKLYPAQDTDSYGIPLFIAGRSVSAYIFEPVFEPGTTEAKLLSGAVIKEIDLGTTEKHIVIEVPRKNALHAKTMFAKVFR